MKRLLKMKMIVVFLMAFVLGGVALTASAQDPQSTVAPKKILLQFSYESMGGEDSYEYLVGVVGHSKARHVGPDYTPKQIKFVVPTLAPELPQISVLAYKIHSDHKSVLFICDYTLYVTKENGQEVVKAQYESQSGAVGAECGASQLHRLGGGVYQINLPSS